MPIGLSVVASSVSPRGETVRSASIVSKWRGVIDAGGPAVQDNASITNPTTQIIAETRHIFVLDNAGSFVCLRLAYDDGLTSITNPIVKVFGRTGADVWQILKTRAGSITGTLTTAATDVTDGTLCYTTPDSQSTTWDCLGCEEILVGVETALAGTGTTSNSIIQARIF